MARFAVITGMSGAGRTESARRLEDMGWFVIENLPPDLIGRIVEFAATQEAQYARVALVEGQSVDPDQLLGALREAAEGGHEVTLVYLDANTDELVRRYENTRRPHPRFSPDTGLAEAIETERTLLAELRSASDVVLDTSRLSVHQLGERLTALLGATDTGSDTRVSILSFGYKHGLPPEADLVFDCRFIANPHWVPELREKTGLDRAVLKYVLEQPVMADFEPRLQAMLALIMPAYVQENRAYLTIAFGCTGGKHRSVVLAERCADWMRSYGYSARVAHRELAAANP